MDFSNSAAQRAAARLDAVRTSLDAAIRAARRDPRSVRLIAVSKTHPADAIRVLYEFGLRDFGENYAQELVRKAAELSDLTDLRFSFIGTLQSNKIARIVMAASEIQTVASLRHAELVAKAVREAAKAPYPVWIAAHAGDESTKSGAPLADVVTLARAIQTRCPELDLQGLMAIPPPLTVRGVVPPLYKTLADLSKAIGKGGLSLGMSADLDEAIAAGSTVVRVGTALFGPRFAAAP